MQPLDFSYSIDIPHLRGLLLEERTGFIFFSKTLMSFNTGYSDLTIKEMFTDVQRTQKISILPKTEAFIMLYLLK